MNLYTTESDKKKIDIDFNNYRMIRNVKRKNKTNYKKVKLKLNLQLTAASLLFTY